jgi:hypothetical protein
MTAIIGIGIYIIMSVLVGVVVELLSLKFVFFVRIRFKFTVLHNTTITGILSGIAIILSVIVCLIFF